MNRNLFQRTAGFTLLEVMVALALIASIGMGIYSWINTNLKSLDRVKTHALRHHVSRNALAFMTTVNPMTEPTGNFELGDFAISWQAKKTDPTNSERGITSNNSLYELALYETSVIIEQDGNKIADFKLRQAGYRQVTEFMPGLW